MLFGFGGLGALVGAVSGVTGVALLVLVILLCIAHPIGLIGVALATWAMLRIARRIDAVASGRAGRHGG